MKNAEFVTSIRVTDIRFPRDGDVDQVSTTVRGQFMFDGRIRSDQAGRFVTVVAPGELTTHIETNFTVKVIKSKHTQWRDMKSCPQKGKIQSELTARVMEHLAGEQNENTQETDPEEFDVETERALAEADQPNSAGQAKAAVEVDLNAVVAAAAVEDSNDLLEIPNFLKRS